MSTATLENPDVEETPRRNWGERIRAEASYFAKLLAVMFTLFTLVFGHYKIPGESMQPALEVGDHLYVSKHPYGYGRHSLPFGLHRLPIGDWHLFTRAPERGDVVVFRNTLNADMVMIKRVVGIPGDTVQTIHGRLFINGVRVEREPIGEHLYREHKQADRTTREVHRAVAYRESLPGEDGSHVIWEKSDGLWLDDTPPIILGADEVFLMGDNRDRSTDSRANFVFDRPDPTAPGRVPISHLIGRAEMMMFSFNRCKTEEGLRCPGRRWFVRL